MSSTAGLTLTDALGISGRDAIALVGGGGKTTAMFRLASEIVAAGGRALTTTTTKIFAAQIHLAPSHVPAADATRERVGTALAEHGHVLVIGDEEPATGKAQGISVDLFARLRAWFPDVCMIDEADGSRMRPFKAPARHEPVIPKETTVVAAVVGADVFGQPLDAEHVHRPELVAALSGAVVGTPVTPEIVARVLAHPDGARKGVPPSARVVAIINKVERLADRAAARRTAELLLREPAIHAVLFTTLRSDTPVLEVLTR